MNLGDLVDIGTGGATLVALVAIAFGLLNCFFGYRIFKFMLGLYGFLLGAIAGFVIVGAVTEGQVLWLALGALIGGVVGAGLMVLLYFVGVFVVGAVAGAVLVSAIGTAFDMTMPPVVVIIVAVIVGIVALILQRAVIILSTAFSGSWAVVTGGASLIIGPDVPLLDLLSRPAAWQEADLPLFVFLAVWLVLGVAGTVVQFRTTKDKAARPPKPADDSGAR